MEAAGAGLRKIVVGALQKASVEDAAVLAWPLVCGTAVAEKTTALDFAEGVLRVQVPDAAWRKQLSGLLPHYVSGLNRIVDGKVRKVSFVLAAELKKEAQRAAARK